MHWRISREELIELSLLVGTDFNEGLKGIGPKKALGLIQEYHRIENLPEEIRSKISTQNYEEARRFFLRPKVTNDYSLEYGALLEDELYNFLCEERGFSRERVTTVVQRMREFYAAKSQAKLKEWFTHD
jgi:flap endonuclease-1